MPTESVDPPSLSRRPSIPILVSIGLAFGALGARAQEPPPAQWLRLDPLPSEMRLTPRESFDGVPPRFALLTDGSVFVGGRRDVLRGALDQREMQAISTRLDLAMKSFGKAGAPKTLVVGEGPAIFRFSVLLGAPVQFVVMGALPESAGLTLGPMPDFVRGLANFRHPSLRPFDPAEFAMVVREKSLAGGCRTAAGLPPLSQSLSAETVVKEVLTRTFPTGAEMAQVCEGARRYIVVFRPLIPGER